MSPPTARPGASPLLASADLLVVGGGVAGLRAAIDAASAGMRVMLFAKDSPSDSNTEKAQGGVAVALSDEDEVGLHHRDTIAAGDGLCDEDAVAALVEEGPRYIMELIEWGARFDRDGARLAFAREGAHSARRILHAAGDSTGQEFVRALLDKASTVPGIEYLPRTYTVDLILEDGRCHGLLVLDERLGTLKEVRGSVLLATGGCGQVFRETTNPPQATGDGIAMAYRAGAWVRDMEFVQFHPTSLAVPGAPRFLLSEALRGEGGHLRDKDGRRFMLDVDPVQAELAPRDVVSRAIALKMIETGQDHMILDLTHLDPDFVVRRFPRIYRTCLGYGVDIARDPIPVSPSAHYMMGGVTTDLWGRTSVPGLYAAGEVACIGVHGANRLASNSLLEGLVFGARAGQAAVADVSRPAPVFDPGSRSEQKTEAVEGLIAPQEQVVAPEAAALFTKKVRGIAWDRAGILRDGPGLRGALADLRGMSGRGGPEPVTRAGVEARNAHVVVSLIAAAALLREESRGAHRRADFPRRDDARYRRSLLLGLSGEVREVAIAASESGGSA